MPDCSSASFQLRPWRRSLKSSNAAISLRNACWRDTPRDLALRLRALRCFPDRELRNAISWTLAVFESAPGRGTSIPCPLVHKGLTRPQVRFSMHKMSENQHRWKKSLGNEIVEVLTEAAREIRLSWEADRLSGEYYPLHTDVTFHELKERLRGKPRVERPIKLPLPGRPPQHLYELIKEKTVKAVYEDQNNGGYEEALRIAGGENEKAHPTFRKLLRAIVAAYEIRSYGWEAMPKPRVHFLHRNLLEVAALAGLSDLMHQGFVEFLDDVCPCGERHTAEAVRKLRKRCPKADTKNQE